MANSVVIRVREQTKGAPGIATVLWAIAMAVSLFGIQARLGRSFFEVFALVCTVLLGAYLGWLKRTGTVFVAPFVSWLFAWVPLIIAEMIHDGFVKGLLFGAFWVTFGWVIIGGAELVVLLAIALPFRVLSGLTHHDQTIIIDRPADFS